MPRNGIRRWSSLLALIVLAGLLGAAVGGMTVRAAPQRQASNVIVINEVVTDPQQDWSDSTGGDGIPFNSIPGTGSITDTDEWIELYNAGTTAVNLQQGTGWVLNITDSSATDTLNFLSSPGTSVFVFSNGGSLTNFQAGEYLVIGNPPGTMNNDVYLALMDSSGALIDNVEIGNAGVGTANDGAPDGVGNGNATGLSNEAIARVPNATDTNNNVSDFVQQQATVGATNNLPIPIPTETYTPTATFTPSNTTTATATYTPIAPPHIVISEFRSTGPLGAGDEFVEVFNATGATTNIGGWTIKKSTGCGTSLSTLFTFPLNVTLAPGQHYLAAATGSTYASTADMTYSSGLADTGGIALVTSASVVADAAGMCTTTTYREGVPLAPLLGTANQSYERKPGGTAGGCYDLDNNATDFALISPASPMKSTDAKNMCTGVILASPTATSTSTRTPTPTRTPSPVPGIIVINEILPHPSSDWNGDGVVNYGDEYIELINAGQEEYTLKNWTLTDNSGAPLYIIPSITLLPQQILILFHSQTGISLSDGGDGVFLYRNNGATNDALTFPVVESADRTWCRIPDGRGTWSFGCWPSPGKPNAWTGAGMPTPPAQEPVCPLADVVPPVIQYPECGSSGDSIWGSSFWMDGKFWLKTGDKDVFVE